MDSRTTQGGLWSEIAKGRTATHSSWALPIYHRMLDAFELAAGSAILDAGCGTGEGSAVAVERGFEVTGSDSAAEMIEIARNKHPDANFEIAPTEDLPFEDARFGGAVAVNSLHFCRKIPQATRELYRVLKPGGKVAICCLGPRQYELFADVTGALLRLVPAEHAGDERFVDPYRLSAPGVVDFLLEEAGFVDLAEFQMDLGRRVESAEKLSALFANVALFKAVESLVGAEKALAAINKALEPDRDSDGSVMLRTNCRIVHARKPA